MKREDLRKISSIEELEAARSAIGSSLLRRQEAMRKDLSRIQNQLRPASLLESGWRLVAPAGNRVNRLLLGVVRGLKSALKR